MHNSDVKKLINLIKERTPLYNSQDKRYSNRTSVEELWGEIAMEMNIDVLECKKKWICLRNSYARYLREVRASDLRGKQRKEWYLADDMAFLRDYVNLQPPNIASIYNGNLINPDEDSQSSPSDSSTSSAKNSPVPLKKFKTSATDIEEDGVVVEEEEEEEEEEEDALMPIMKVEMKAYDEPSETKEDAASENSRLHEAEMEEESEMSEYEKPRTRRKTRSKKTTVKKMEKTRYAQSATNKSTPPKSTRSEEPRENGNALFFKSLLIDYENLSNRGQRTFRMYMLEKMNELQEHEENE